MPTLGLKATFAAFASMGLEYRQSFSKETQMPFYERDNVRIRYEESGSGFPLLAIPGGGHNSCIAFWDRMPFNPMEEFKSDFRVISMDQRNAPDGQSTGPVQVNDPWGAFADDQIGLMDHLGISEFLFIGFCIGGPFGLKIAQRIPGRMQAVVMSQPVGHNLNHPDAMYDSAINWGTEHSKKQPDVTADQVEAYARNLYRSPADFVYSVDRDFVRGCQVPILVMPDNSPAHSYDVAIEVTKIAPNVETTIYPWKDSPEHIAEAVSHVRRFLKAHEPVTAGRK